MKTLTNIQVKLRLMEDKTYTPFYPASHNHDDHVVAYGETEIKANFRQIFLHVIVILIWCFNAAITLKYTVGRSDFCIFIGR